MVLSKSCATIKRMDSRFIRNFCIIAHIDHGKSTLADRLLEATGAVDPREMVEQRLDSMDLERERGITIKAQAVRLEYTSKSGEKYQLNLIDTPGHVDFSYEVSRSLAACEGALLIVDASQGVQAQTLANVYLAVEQDLEIIPVVNKIDLDVAEPQRVALEIEKAFGFEPGNTIFASAKEGNGVSEILEAIVHQISPPTGNISGPVRALVFDSRYDPYKGVVAYVRVFDGSIPQGCRVRVMATQKESDVLEVGCFRPEPTRVGNLAAGEVGYVATGLKVVGDAPVGSTITLASNAAPVPLDTYVPLKPVVFAGFYPTDGEDYLDLRDALEKLQVNDASLVFQQETSAALGSGFRCGFLGLLHMEVVQERLEREFKINLLATSPSVAYRIVSDSGEEKDVDNPSMIPAAQFINEIKEPWVKLTILAPVSFMGVLIDLVTVRRGELNQIEHINYSEDAGQVVGLASNDSSAGVEVSGSRVMLDFSMPLSEMLVGFYDQMKSRTQGYASMDYTMAGYRTGNLVRLDVLVNEEPVDALSLVVHKDTAPSKGKELTTRLKGLIPRQLFEVPIQAAIGGRVVARETVKALRKNVLAKCYGGDVTRKRKLLEKQAAGKRRMKRVGRVEIPQEAFLSVLKMDR